MLSRLHSLRVLHQLAPSSSRINNSVRQFRLDVAKFGRYTRDSLRERLYKRSEILKTTQNQTNATLSDSIPLRPVRHLLWALGFTVVSGICIYNLAAIIEVLRIEENNKKLFSDPQSLFVDMKRFLEEEAEKVYHSTQARQKQSISPAQACIFSIIATNILITLMWRFRPIEPIMWRYFTNSLASKSLCSPMLLSVFSHKSGIHLALNMYVLWSFATPAINRFLGVEQFMAFYLTGGIVSSLISLMHKSLIRSAARSLGASGAILAALSYVCMKIPEARLQIIFLPFFDFSAETAIYGIILFDLVGLLIGFRLFDHAAHLGGSLFGLLYANYGEKWYRDVLLPRAVAAYKRMKAEEQKQNKPKRPRGD